MSGTWLARAVVFALSVALATGQNPPLLKLKSWDPPYYPPLARQARIQGQVHLEFFVNHLGEVASVNVLSGHPMLAPAATENVKTWRFEVPKDTAPADKRYETVISFELSNEDLGLPDGVNVQTVIESFNYVRVIAATPTIDGVQKHRCPSGKEKIPPVGRGGDDFIEMSRSGCFGTCPVYTVRIHANGIVDWDGRSFVTQKRKDSGNVGSSVARELLDRVSSSEFWELCESYARMITDSATTTFEVRIGDRKKTVSNYADSAPEFVEGLEYAVDEAADTHRWLHGDPREEPLSHIRRDGYGPKPGLTKLMKAAARADAKTVKTLLHEGEDPNAADSSGWTAVMYATTERCEHDGCMESPEAIDLLLAAGGNPNYSSPRGYTPLMAAAFDRRFEVVLVRAGADVNAQDAEGVSTLMILAAHAVTDAIKQALLAGANAKLKDARGRTALDYLLLAGCGRSPLRDPSLSDMSDSGDCEISAGDDNFQRSQRLLKEAMVKTR